MKRVPLCVSDAFNEWDGSVLYFSFHSIIARVFAVGWVPSRQSPVVFNGQQQQQH